MTHDDSLFRFPDPYYRNPVRKMKRSNSNSSGGLSSKPTCSECGKKFGSLKALYGHMRCHPERQWRGMNPSHRDRPRHKRITTQSTDLIDADCNHPLYLNGLKESVINISEDEEEVAASLLLLAYPNANANGEIPNSVMTENLENISGYEEAEADPFVGRFQEAAAVAEAEDVGIGSGQDSDLRVGFECSSCKKVFGSRQALGGHRASHKNVKGCFAVTRSDGREEQFDMIDNDNNKPCSCSTVGGVDHEQTHFNHNTIEEAEEEDHKVMMMVINGGHKCSICLRVFSSGQALGGHMRRHWEKGDSNGPSSVSVVTRQQGLSGVSYPLGIAKEGCGFDLNLPASRESESSSFSASALTLDLKLGL